MPDKTETLKAEAQQLLDDLREAYRLVDTYYADMSQEASDDLEQHFIEALERARDRYE